MKFTKISDMPHVLLFAHGRFCSRQRFDEAVYLLLLSKDVQKSNFRQYGKMKSREEKQSQKKKETVGRNVRKVANRCFFPMVGGSGGSKSRFAKAAGAESCLQGRKHVQIKMLKN